MNNKILANSMMEDAAHKPNKQLHLICAPKPSRNHPKYEETHSIYYTGIIIHNPFKDLAHQWNDRVFERDICPNGWRQYRKSSNYKIGGKT